MAKIIQRVLPDGFTVIVPTRKVLDKKETGYESDMMVFLIVYCGESKPLTRTIADMLRNRTETEVERYFPLRSNRKGRLVSKEFPYMLLPSILGDY